MVEQLAASFEQSSGVEVVVSTAASGTLAQQIRHGAPPGVFLSANIDWADKLEEWELTEAGSRSDLLGNSLVVVVPRGSAFRPASLQELRDARFAKIALADPGAVPAGIYARTALERAKVWSAVEHRIVSAADVRAALAYVARGEVDAGVVYATDVANGAGAGVDVAFTIPAGGAPAIVYPIVLTKGASDADRALLQFLQSEAALGAFRAAGFSTPR